VHEVESVAEEEIDADRDAEKEFDALRVRELVHVDVVDFVVDVDGDIDTDETEHDRVCDFVAEDEIEVDSEAEKDGDVERDAVKELESECVKVRLLDGVTDADLVGVGENELESVNVVECVPVRVREVLGVVEIENVFDNVEVSDDVGEAD
jgi:hypothetical protein